MKTSSFLFLLPVLLAPFALACEVDEETADEQNVSASKDDAFLTQVLKGGCSFTQAQTGKTLKTKGSGGKCPTTVSGVLDLLEKDPKNELKVFVVSEEADQSDADQPFRFVIAAKTAAGSHDKLFFSTLGTASGMNDEFFEVMAFSKSRGAYVYYELDGGEWVQAGDGNDVALEPDPQNPPFRCAGCHTTGAPLMKELHDSWMNWNSTWMSISEPANNKDPLLKRLFEKVERADDLEPIVIAGIEASNKKRVDRAVKEKNLKPLMKQLLCDVGEPSLIAAHNRNSKRLGTVETFSSMLPSSILVNNLFKTPQTGTGPQLGLKDVLALDIPALDSVSVDSGSYVKALGTTGSKINGKKGDALFPMSSPEKSFADIAVVQELFARKLVDKEIIADVLMTDFTVSTFSSTRCALAETLPDNWKTASELKKAWIANLGSSDLRGAAGLKARLEKDDQLAEHAKALDTFVAACNKRGEGTQASKDAYAVDLLKVISQRRLEFKEVYEQVVESPWLLPTDTLGSQPHKIRLNGTTCKIEDQSKPFVGE